MLYLLGPSQNFDFYFDICDLDANLLEYKVFYSHDPKHSR